MDTIEIRISRARRARLARTAVVTWVGITAGLALASFGAEAAWISLVLVTLALAFGLWNTTPFLFKPRPAYILPSPEKVRWPEALPIQPAGRHRRLILCVHGFPSTPADFRKILAVSDARGWDVAAPLLPGCGTEPKDILATEWSQYLAAVTDIWDRLRPNYDEACMVGISMGGALVLALAEATCADPARAPLAMSTVAAPITLNAWTRHGIVKSPLLYAARFLGPIVPSIGAAFPDPDRVGEDGDNDWKGYLGTYTKQSYTLQVGMRAVERRLPQVTCPILVCHARGDRMVDFRNAGILMSQVGSNDIEAYTANMDQFRHKQHNLLAYDSQRDRVWSRILDFFEARSSQSHR
jgi:carboxylesterase